MTEPVMLTLSAPQANTWDITTRIVTPSALATFSSTWSAAQPKPTVVLVRPNGKLSTFQSTPTATQAPAKTESNSSQTTPATVLTSAQVDSADVKPISTPTPTDFNAHQADPMFIQTKSRAIQDQEFKDDQAEMMKRIGFLDEVMLERAKLFVIYEYYGIG